MTSLYQAAAGGDGQGDAGALVSFQHKIHEAVALVQSMNTEQKLKAVQLWNFVSESLQDMVNSSANDIYSAMSGERYSLHSHILPDCSLPLQHSYEQPQQQRPSACAAAAAARPGGADFSCSSLQPPDTAAEQVTSSSASSCCSASTTLQLLSDQSLLYLPPASALDQAVAASTCLSPATAPLAADFVRPAPLGDTVSQQRYPHSVHCPPAVPFCGAGDELARLLTSADSGADANCAEADVLLSAALTHRQQQQLELEQQQQEQRAETPDSAVGGWRAEDDSLLVGLCSEPPLAPASGAQMEALPPMPSLLDTASRRVSQPPAALGASSEHRAQPVATFTYQPGGGGRRAGYRCSVCALTFGALRSFYAHYETHCGRCVCRQCGLSFARRAQLIAHVSTTHPPHVTSQPPHVTSHPPHVTSHPPQSTSHPPQSTSHPSHATSHPPHVTSQVTVSSADSAVSTAAVLVMPAVTTASSTTASSSAAAAAAGGGGGAGPGTSLTGSALEYTSTGASVSSSPTSATAATAGGGGGGGVHSCSVCGREFGSRSNLSRHMRRHTGERPFGCHLCSRRFAEKKSLQVHWRVHTGERPFACSVCPARFRQQGNLDSHMEGHVGLRPHLCHLCGKRFRQRSQLRLHTQRHEDRKQFKCDLCPLAFNVLSDLVRHKRCHLDTKPFRCDVCEKTFCRPEALNEHLNRHFDHRPFCCPHCDRTFPELSACRRHIKKHGQTPRPVPADRPASDPPLPGAADPSAPLSASRDSRLQPPALAPSTDLAQVTA